MRTPVWPSSWKARMRCSGIPRPTWMSGEVTSIPSLTRSGRPSASFASSAPAGKTWTAFRVSSAIPIALRRLDVRGRDLVRGAATEERERVLGLLAQDLEHLRNALVAAEGQAVHRRPADEDCASAQRERHRDVRAPAYAAVEVHLGAVADRLDDLRQRLQRRDRAVELAAAVVRDDNARRAVLTREVRVLRRDEPLDDDGDVP